MISSFFGGKLLKNFGGVSSETLSDLVLKFTELKE